MQKASLGKTALIFGTAGDVSVTLIRPQLNDLWEFTFEAWIRPTTSQHVLLFGQKHVMELALKGKELFLYTTRGDIRHVVKGKLHSYPVDEWHHVAAVCDRYLCRIYADGILLATEYFTYVGVTYGITSLDDRAVMGKGGYGRSNASNFQGEMDEVRLWRYASGGSEITEAMYRRLNGTASGLIGYWYFDDQHGTKVVDRSGNGNHGHITGTVLTAPSPLKANVFFAGVDGHFGQSSSPILADIWQHLAVVHRQSYALPFDGKDDHLIAEHAATLNVNRDLTLEAFFQVEELETAQALRP